MKIAILCTQQQEGEAELFRELLSVEGVAASVCRVSVAWETEMPRWIDGHTHFFVVLDGDLSAPWFQYLAGFCSGSGRTLLVRSSAALPPHLEQFPTVDGDAEMIRFWRTAGEEWRRTEEVRLATEALARSGLAFSEEEFCRCVADGEVRAVELFFRAGMKPEVRNRSGVPALALAVRGSHRTLIEMLLEAGARVDSVSADRGNTALMDAAAAGDLEVAEELIRAGADLDVRSKNGQTALILAVGQGSVEIAARLIEAGADFTVTDSLGMSAEGYAKLFKQQKILDLIGNRRGETGEDGDE